MNQNLNQNSSQTEQVCDPRGVEVPPQGSRASKIARYCQLTLLYLPTEFGKDWIGRMPKLLTPRKVPFEEMSGAVQKYTEWTLGELEASNLWYTFLEHHPYPLAWDAQVSGHQRTYLLAKCLLSSVG